MSLVFGRKAFLPQGLAVAVTALMMNSAHAMTEQQELQQLRAEVTELKALIQQHIPQAAAQGQAQGQVALSGSATPEATPNVVPLSQQPGNNASPTAPATPPSALTARTTNGAEVKLYGFVRGDAAYQFKGGNGIFNRINKVSLSNDADRKANEDRFDATATTTRIGVDFKTPVQGADIGGKVEVDFRGGTNADSVRIRHAYLTYDDWLFGQTTSSFLSLETTPEMLDFNAPLGIGTYRTPMIRYSQNLDADTRYFLGLEKGNDSNRWPAATAKISHKLSDSTALLTGRALLQQVRAREANDDTEFGWGVGVGAKFTPTEQLTLNADYSHVKGDDKFISYTENRYSVDGNDIDLNEFNAFTLGATYKFTPQWRSTLAYGAVFYDDAKATTTTDPNDKLQQGWLNVMFNPVKPVTFGAEYVYGERETAAGVKGRDSRIGMMAKYDF